MEWSTSRSVGSGPVACGSSEVRKMKEKSPALQDEEKAGEGVRMVRENLARALHDAGLQEIPAKGRVFDPYEMDCIEQVPEPEGKDGTVKEVVRKGYRLHDRVLRPAQVIVVKNRGETNG